MLAVTSKPVLTLKRVLDMPENCVVINGVRYDLVPDLANVCDGCDLAEECYEMPKDFMLCENLFGISDYHFKKKR